ncbi:MAG: hypothetical protein WBG67_19810 [Thermoanaerobaculia bacterium]
MKYAGDAEEALGLEQGEHLAELAHVDERLGGAEANEGLPSFGF